MALTSGAKTEIFMRTFWEGRFVAMSPMEVMQWRRRKFPIDGDLLALILLWPTYIRRILDNINVDLLVGYISSF